MTEFQSDLIVVTNTFRTDVIFNDPIQPDHYKIIMTFGGMFRMYLDLSRVKILFHKNQNLSMLKCVR